MTSLHYITFGLFIDIDSKTVQNIKEETRPVLVSLNVLQNCNKE